MWYLNHNSTCEISKFDPSYCKLELARAIYGHKMIGLFYSITSNLFSTEERFSCEFQFLQNLQEQHSRNDDDDVSSDGLEGKGLCAPFSGLATETAAALLEPGTRPALLTFQQKLRPSSSCSRRRQENNEPMQSKKNPQLTFSYQLINATKIRVFCVTFQPFFHLIEFQKVHTIYYLACSLRLSPWMKSYCGDLGTPTLQPLNACFLLSAKTSRSPCCRK